MSALVWLTWRQHRWAIVSVAILALLAAYVLASTEGGTVGSLLVAVFYGLLAQFVFGGLIGVFWGAPLIARELEERTYFVAWGQDVTPLQWLRGKVLLLGATAVVLGAVIGFSGGFLIREGTWGAFEANPLVQAGYAIFGFALGLLIGLLFRHVVTAMAATLVVYTITRVVLAALVRDHYLPVERKIVPWKDTLDLPQAALELGRGFVGPDLTPVAVTPSCAQLLNPTICMRSSNAAVGTYVDYQPVERLGLFQLMEAGLYVLMAAALFAVTFRLLRRGGGWKPSRRHRRIDSAVAVVAETESEPAAAQG